MEIKKFGKRFKLIQENNKTRLVEEEKLAQDIDIAFDSIKDKYIKEDLETISDIEKDDIMIACKGMQVTRQLSYRKMNNRNDDYAVSPDGYRNPHEIERVEIAYPAKEMIDKYTIQLSKDNRKIVIDLNRVVRYNIWISENPNSLPDKKGKVTYNISIDLMMRDDNICEHYYVCGFYKK
jgi:predicted transcriptional regulator